MKTIEEVLAEVDRLTAELAKSFHRDIDRDGENALRELRDFILGESTDPPYPWGPAPSADEATAHEARPGCSMGLWLRRWISSKRQSSGDGKPEIAQLDVEDAKVREYPNPIIVMSDWEYRPINDEGVLVLRPARTA